MGKIKNITLVCVQFLRFFRGVLMGYTFCQNQILLMLSVRTTPFVNILNGVHLLLINMVHLRPFVIRRKFHTDHHTVPSKGKILSPEMILVVAYDAFV